VVGFDRSLVCDSIDAGFASRLKGRAIGMQTGDFGHSESSASLLELSTLVLAHARHRRPASVAISRREGYCRTHHAMGVGPLRQCLRRLHEYRDGTQSTGGSDHESVAHPLEFHQTVGLIYFALMALMPFLGGSLLVASSLLPPS
ncbi:MAG TPA: hypothetical protein VLL57_12935, partial [Candidatus Binataceae bacterium]|nr:hypothetical protein [Candidatus Binataceae bacterium]